MAWSAIVDGSDKGLPDVPVRMMATGRINKSPTGEKVKVIMGTNECEGCLFVMLAPIVDKHVTIPITDDGVGWIEKHMVSYHDNWNATSTSQVNAAYPSAQFSSGNFRFASMLTDFIFACGTRTAVRNLADQGGKGHGGARAKEVDSGCRGAGT